MASACFSRWQTSTLTAAMAYRLAFRYEALTTRNFRLIYLTQPS
uniref:Uncharacterized protein n=1 Tax=Anguilla anguilla TaxID=7936 RepID=A0A0E9QKY7_ANGAN